MRKSSKFIIVAGALAALAVPSVASANVAVENGVGTVAKSDVQAALKWNNSDFDKGASTIKFTATLTRTTDNVWSCTDGSTQHRDRVSVMEQTANATPVLSSNGKQITGWNLTGFAAAPYKVLSDTGIPADALTCPAGSTLDFTKPFAINQLGVAKYNTYATGGLTVTGNGKTVDLPNTPVEVAPAA